MRKRSRFFVANIVLGVIFAVAFLISLMITLSVKAVYDGFMLEGGWLLDQVTGSLGTDDSYSDYDDVSYMLPVIQETSVLPVGPEYQGKEAYDGYQFYLVKLLIHNGGTECVVADYLDLRCEGEDICDVYLDYSIRDYDSPLAYSDLEVIPSCQTAWVEKFVQVKEGVSRFTLELVQDYDSESVQRVEIDLDAAQ